MPLVTTASLKIVFWKYVPVVIGLGLGTAAKFGRMMTLGQPISRKLFFGHCLMMGVVGLAAVFAVKVSGIKDPSAVAFASAIFAIAANNIVEYLATRAWKKLLQDPGTIIGEERQRLQRKASGKAVERSIDKGELS